MTGGAKTLAGGVCSLGYCVVTTDAGKISIFAAQ